MAVFGVPVNLDATLLQLAGLPELLDSSQLLCSFLLLQKLSLLMLYLFLLMLANLVWLSRC
jgi:hypothetical protein